MGSRQRVRRAPALDAELARPIGAPEGREALVGNAGGARDELEQLELLLVVELVDGVPEPGDRLVVLVVAGAVVGVLLPVVDVDFEGAAEHELQFARVERLHLLRLDHLVEAFE